MNLPTISPCASIADGLIRSAALMRALGSHASAVWSTLSPQEAQHLTSAMEALPDSLTGETDAARAYVRDMAQRSAAVPVHATNFWTSLSAEDGAAVATQITKESPQIIAVILSRLPAETAAATVRLLPPTLATEALHRLLHLGDVRPTMVNVLETQLRTALSHGGAATPNSGQARVARIFDSLNPRSEQALLASLDTAEPGIGERIRALMFTFDDLATLDPASIQTLLAGTDRAVLILALKGAGTETANTFYNNMTARASELLRSEIAAAGPVRRREIDEARAEIVAFARTLVNRGDILSQDKADEELVE